MKNGFVASTVLIAAVVGLSMTEMNGGSSARDLDKYKSAHRTEQSLQPRIIAEAHQPGETGEAAGQAASSQNTPVRPPEIQSQEELEPHATPTGRQEAGIAARSETTVNPDWATSTYPHDPNTPQTGRIHVTPGLPNTDTPSSGVEFGTEGRPLPVAPSRR